MTSEAGPPEASVPQRGARRTREWLERHGYAVHFRRDGWVECLVEGLDETWQGRGSSEELALADALRAMLPSALARTLAGASIDAAESLPVAEEAAAKSAPEADPQAAETPGEPKAPPPARGEPDDADEPAPRPRPVEVTVIPGPPPDIGLRDITLREGRDELALLEDCIAAEQPELALSAPERQRLVVLGWMCQARSVQEVHQEVSRKVAGIARELTRLCKVWWPGSVRALQLDALPQQAAREAGAEDAGEIYSWARAAEAVHGALVRLVAADDAAGRDEYGWADAAADAPPPDPDGRLAEIKAQLDKHTGPIHEPPSHRDRADELLRQLDLQGLERMALTLRWLRHHVQQFEDWGAALGRLRWAEHMLRDRHDAPGLRQALEPDYRPPMQWTRLLGLEPHKRRRQRARRRLLEALRQGPPLEAEGLAAWFLEAYPLFDTPRLAALLSRYRDTLLELSDEAITERVDDGDRRNARRRFVALQKRLAGEGDGDIDAAVRTLEEELARIEPADEDDAPETDETAAPVVDAGEALRRQAVAHTTGRRAIVISNRADPELQARLKDQLEFAELDWSEGEPRRLDGLCDAVARHRYDLVMAATGFQSHSVDARVGRACRKAKVPYLRVNRARPLAVQLAILRDLAGSAPENMTTR
jgi:hypothetical protein